MPLKSTTMRVQLVWLLAGWAGIVALIALNRGIDLLWGVWLVLVVAIVVAALMPKWQLRGFKAMRQLFPSGGVVGQPLDITYELHASGPFVRHGIELYENLSGHDAIEMVGYVPSLRGTQSVRWRWTPAVRGCFRLSELTVASRYPLGLSSAKKVFALQPHEILIYPDFVPLHAIPLSAEAPPNYDQAISRRRGGRDEFYGVRDYHPGDEMRAIHWRAMARRGDVVVKEYEQQTDRRIWMFLDLAQVSHVGHAASSTLEYMIRIAHSVAVKAQRDGVAVGMLYIQNGELRRIEASADRDSYLQLRDALARMQAEPQPSLRTWLAARRGQLPDGGAWLLFNLWQTDERTTMQTLAQQRHASAVMVEFDKQSFANKTHDGKITSQRAAHGALYRVECGADLRELFKPV